MPKLTITRGFPGSGKSTWADAQIKQSKGKTIGVNRDMLRMMTGRQWWPANEAVVTAVQQAAVRAAHERGLDCIVDDTFLKQTHVMTMEAFAKHLGFEVEVKSFLHVPLHTCIDRDRHRERSVGKDVIVQMYYDYWAAQPKPLNEGKPAIICDIDGTIAHTLVPYPAAYSRDYLTDELDWTVWHLAHTYCFRPDDGPDLILVSGRNEKHRAVTEEWLHQHAMEYDELFMRPEEDEKTDDATVKKALYMQHIQGKYEVLFCIDDRPRVCRMWEAELGLKVLNVGNGIEF